MRGLAILCTALALATSLFVNASELELDSSRFSLAKRATSLSTYVRLSGSGFRAIADLLTQRGAKVLLPKFLLSDG